MHDVLIDTHAHLDQEEFAADRDEVIAAAEANGVARIITVGVTVASSKACIELAARHPCVAAAVGIQPNSVAAAEAGDFDRIVRLTQAPGVVAIGETGLDRYWDFTPFPQQEDYFDRHLRLSQKCGLPFVVHMRDCADDILKMLRDARHRGPLRGVMHSYTGDADMARECIEMGLHISFAGMVTFKKSGELRDVATTIPADRLLVETDSPYLSPEPVRKIRRNQPAHVRHTLEALAVTRGVAATELARQTTENARELFRLS